MSDEKSNEKKMNFNSDIVIGLEIHVELNTNTKLFCGCTRIVNEDELPNTRVCEICLGQPGCKPKLNKKALEYSLKLALALNCNVTNKLIFSRKSYFYPDMAKNYQISQFEEPLGLNGFIELSDGEKINLTRIHIEEDPASLVHPNGMHSSNYVLIDYNRSGNCLCEIVTNPEIKSANQAREFMKNLISILKYLKIYDPKTCIIKADANISIKESNYVRAEVKNITGFKEIQKAIEYEIKRQKQDLKEGKQLIQETRNWDSKLQITKRIRVKETEDDYGYIIDPDLVSINITEEMIKKIKENLPELATNKTKRYINDYKLNETDSKVIAQTYELASIFEKVIKKVNPILAAKWLRRELVRVMNYNKIEFEDLKINIQNLTDLLNLVENKKITENVAQKILEELVIKDFNVIEYVREKNLELVNDSSLIEEYCVSAIKESKNAVDDYLSGNEKSLNFIVGIVMKKSKGRASPKEVKDLILKLIKK
ncbi:MAG: Asp-tRNA(Asn)/Glu-tRNA(Gln) amidotransferase subunit GatB [Candidatus Woesearchaeota archaeon]